MAMPAALDRRNGRTKVRQTMILVQDLFLKGRTGDAAAAPLTLHLMPRHVHRLLTNQLHSVSGLRLLVPWVMLLMTVSNHMVGDRWHILSHYAQKINNPPFNERRKEHVHTKNSSLIGHHLVCINYSPLIRERVPSLELVTETSAILVSVFGAKASLTNRTDESLVEPVLQALAMKDMAAGKNLNRTEIRVQANRTVVCWLWRWSTP